MVPGSSGRGTEKGDKGGGVITRVTAVGAGAQARWVLWEPVWSRHLGVIPPCSGNRRAGVGVVTSPWLTAAPRTCSSPALRVCRRLTEQVPRVREEPSGRKTQGGSGVADVH